MIDPFEQPDDETNRPDDHRATCCGRDCADCIIDELNEAVSTKPDDSAAEPCARRGCRGCDKSPPVADLGNEPPF